MSSRVRLRYPAPALLALLLLSTACGGSSSIDVVQPSTSKCGISVSNSVPTIPASGGRGSLTVDTNRECSWSARAEASWISLSGAEGQGPATVTYTVTPNANGTPRQGAVVVGEQRVSVTQDAAPCRYDVSPASIPVNAAGADISVNITAPDGCTWGARGDEGWVGNPTPASGEGGATVRFSVGANPGPPRTGTATVAGVTVQIAQASTAQPPPLPEPGPPAPAPPAPTPAPTPDPPTPTCSYAVSPPRKTIAASGEATTISVTTASGCDWAASSGADWISISGRQGGSGSGSIQVVAERNPGAARSGIVTVAGIRVTLDQSAAPAAPPCAYSIKPGSYNSGRGPDDIVVTVTTDSGCAWTATSQAPWITVTDGRAGSGNGTVRLHVEPNNTGSPRNGTVTIAGQTFSVRQEGLTCSYSIAPTHYEAGPGPDNVRVSVTAENGCAWATTNDAPWIAVTEGRSGTGKGTVRLAVDTNPGGARTATLTIAGQPFTLAQSGCSIGIKPTHYDAGRGPDDIRISVTADAGCAWSTANSAPWVTVTEGLSGAGNGTVRLIVEANSGGPRTATITIGGEPFLLRQEGR